MLKTFSAAFNLFSSNIDIGLSINLSTQYIYLFILLGGGPGG